MNFSIERHTAVAFNADQSDSNFSPEVAAAMLGGSLLKLPPLAPILTLAAGAWPNPYSQVLANAGLVGAPGILIVDRNGNVIPFRVKRIQSAIGQQFRAGTIDLSPALRSLPAGMPVISDPFNQGNRFSPVYTFRAVKDQSSILSKGTLSQDDGGNITNEKVLSAAANTAGYSTAQFDELTLFADDPQVLGVEVGYSVNYPSDTVRIRSAIQNLLSGTPAERVHQGASMTSIIDIALDIPYQGFETTAATDYYLIMTRNLSQGIQASAPPADLSLVSPNYTFDKGFGAIQIDVIPFNQITNFPPQGSIDLPALDVTANLVAEPGTGRTNFARFVSSAKLLAYPDPLALKQPLYPPDTTVWS